MLTAGFPALVQEELLAGLKGSRFILNLGKRFSGGIMERSKYTYKKKIIVPMRREG
jgi:hypothetical protein